MLHIHSHNMGMTAGLAWKAAGQEYVPFNEVREDTPLGKFILEVLDLVKKHDEGTDEMMFLPSSFMEGFYNAFHNPCLYK